MKIIEAAELKSIEFELLKKFKEICEKENFRYTLIGGTLLGAVRHSGFIPWDDDIDVSMPRPDYDAFIKYCGENDTPFGVAAHELDEKYIDLSAKLYDKNTIAVEEYGDRFGCNYGVFLDIFPVDAIGDTADQGRKLMKKLRFKKELLVAEKWKGFKRSKTHKWYWEPFRLFFFLLSRFVNPRKLICSIEKELKKRDFDSSETIAVFNSTYRYREILPKSLYEEYSELDFEGEKFAVIKNFEFYLKSIYGDYMKLPPEEKRVTHHSFDAYWKD